MEGNILVDETLASCYACNNHDLTHIDLTPVQWFPDTIGWIFGEETGWHIYTKVAKDLGNMMGFNIQ